ncbi:MAG: VWA domain-containing protein [Bryobacteraceae bacterium]
MRLLAAAVAALACLAQEDAVFRVDVGLVTVPVQVTAPDGSLVRDLKPEDFQLFDAGERQEIRNLWLETELPLTIGIVLDVSDSQGASISAHERTLVDFVSRVLRLGDRAFVVSVGSEVRMLADLTSSREDLIRGLRDAERPDAGTIFGEQCLKRAFAPVPPDPKPLVVSMCGGTALWNGIWSAVRLRLLPATGRKALLILSDGVDTGSSHPLKHAITELHRAQGVVYAIQYPRGPRARASFGLQRLAEESGGLRFPAPEAGSDAAESYAKIFARIEEDLRNQYVIGFRPSSERAGFHPIEVTTGRENLRVRARLGYIAGGEQK